MGISNLSTPHFYESFFENNPAIILVINPQDGKIEDANASACRFYGYAKETLLTLSVWDINILNKEQIIIEMKNAQEQKREVFYFHHRLANGEIRNVEVKSYPIFFDGTKKLCSFVRDITDELKASTLNQSEKIKLEAAIAENTYQLKQELRFKEALFESIPGVLYVYDQNNRLILWNRKHEDITGYTDEELKNMTLEKWFSPDDYQKILPAVDNIFKSGFGQIEADLITKSGKPIRMLFNGVPLEMNGKTYFTGVGLDVTELRDTTKKMIENEKLLNLFFQQSLSGLFFMMMDEAIEWNETADKEQLLDYVFSHQRITKVNQAMLDQYGFKAEEFLNQTPNDSFAHDLEQGRGAWRDLFDQGSLHILTKEMKKDGTPIWIEGDYICLKDNQDRIIGHFGIQNNVTERVESQNKVTYTINLMKYIIEHNNGGVAVHDLNMNYIYVSQHYLDEYGLTGAEVIGKNHYDVFPDLPEKWRKVHQLAMQGVVSSAKDDSYVHENGKTDWTSWECRPFYQEDESIGGVIVYTEVTTARKLLEISLKKQKDLLETTLQSVGDAVISCNNQGQIVLMNKAAEKMLEVTIDKAYNKPIEDFMRIHEDCDLTKNVHVVHRVIKEAKTEELNDCATLKLTNLKEIAISGSVSPIFDKDHHLDGVVLIFRDISFMKQRQEEIIYASLHDSLTGLFNYRAFDIEINKLLTEENLPLVLMMGDINGLKLINDSFGHVAGDQLLISFAKQLVDFCPKDTMIFRYGGDEFVMAFPKMKYEDGLVMITKLKESFSFKQFEPISVSMAMGFEVIHSVTDNIREILTEAENHMYRHKITENSSQKSKTIDVIMNALYAKNDRELYHSKRVSKICAEFAKELSWDENDIKEIEVAGLLHDIGKIGIPEVILNKEGKLTDLEWREIMKHPEVGFRILSSVNEFSKMSIYVLEHQEKWNGTGYPRKMSGNSISIQARIIALADAYDAMTSKRPYRETMTKDQALVEIKKYSGTQFDPQLSETFINMLLRNPL